LIIITRSIIIHLRNVNQISYHLDSHQLFMDFEPYIISSLNQVHLSEYFIKMQTNIDHFN